MKPEVDIYTRIAELRRYLFKLRSEAPERHTETLIVAIKAGQQEIRTLLWVLG